MVVNVAVGAGAGAGAGCGAKELNVNLSDYDLRQLFFCIEWTINDCMDNFMSNYQQRYLTNLKDRIKSFMED